MLIATGGFGWVSAEIVTAPGQQRWGYAGAFAASDGHVWMVTSAHADVT